MTNKLLSVFIAAAALLLVAAPAFAHHGRSNYDETKTTTLKATVTEFEWTNPHAIVRVDVTDENGKVEKWTTELNSPNTLSRQGWDRKTLKPGDHITLVGHRVKSGANYLDIDKVIFADGKEYIRATLN